MEYIRDSNMEMYTVGFADGIEWSEDVGNLSVVKLVKLATCS